MKQPDYIEKAATILADGLGRVAKLLASEIDKLDDRVTALEERANEDEAHRIALAEGRRP